MGAITLSEDLAEARLARAERRLAMMAEMADAGMELGLALKARGMALLAEDTAAVEATRSQAGPSDEAMETVRPEHGRLGFERLAAVQAISLSVSRIFRGVREALALETRFEKACDERMEDRVEARRPAKEAALRARNEKIAAKLEPVEAAVAAEIKAVPDRAARRAIKARFDETMAVLCFSDMPLECDTETLISVVREDLGLPWDAAAKARAEAEADEDDEGDDDDEGWPFPGRPPPDWSG